MKLTKISNLMMLGLALTFVVSGCKKKPTNVTNLPGNKPIVRNNNPFGPGEGLRPPVDPGTTDLSGKIAPNDQTTHMGWHENTDALKAQTIYFDYDKSSVR